MTAFRSQKILVEVIGTRLRKVRCLRLSSSAVKSFLGRSFIHDLEQAVGQYIVYRDILLETESYFELYLAITQGIYKSYFQRQLTQMIINRNQVKLLIVDAESEVIVQWID